jgi:hypothetical protein
MGWRPSHQSIVISGNIPYIPGEYSVTGPINMIIFRTILWCWPVPRLLFLSKIQEIYLITPSLGLRNTHYLLFGVYGLVGGALATSLATFAQNVHRRLPHLTAIHFALPFASSKRSLHCPLFQPPCRAIQRYKLFISFLCTGYNSF